MNKIEYINLGGIPLAVDVDAAHHLQNYLLGLDNYFGKSEHANEIIDDIELRLAELIEESMGSRKVANMKDVKYAINIMGSPEQFDNLEDTEEFAESVDHDFSEERESYQYKRKLYRNPDEKFIAGVCSGISAYFGINDPIWIRLAIVVFTITGGAGILLYIILWIVMPEARTSIDKLRMKGEPIDLQNIERMVEDGFDQISDLADRVSEKFTKKKKKW